MVDLAVHPAAGPTLHGDPHDDAHAYWQAWAPGLPEDCLHIATTTSVPDSWHLSRASSSWRPATSPTSGSHKHTCLQAIPVVVVFTPVCFVHTAVLTNLCNGQPVFSLADGNSLQVCAANKYTYLCLRRIINIAY